MTSFCVQEIGQNRGLDSYKIHCVIYFYMLLYTRLMQTNTGRYLYLSEESPNSTLSIVQVAGNARPEQFERCEQKRSKRKLRDSSNGIR